MPADTAADRAEKHRRLKESCARPLWIRLPLSESAVGTIRAVHETTIGSKLLGRVVEVNLKAGQKVKAGDILVRLDDTDLRAKLQQAKAAVASIEAVRAQAAADEKRYASPDCVQGRQPPGIRKGRHGIAIRRSGPPAGPETVNEVQATLDWATVRSPIDGTVIDKKVDAGDMVTPGQILLTLFDPKRMQLVASVRESLTHQTPGRPEHRRADRRPEQAVQRHGQRDRARGPVRQPRFPGQGYRSLPERASTQACSAGS